MRLRAGRGEQRAHRTRRPSLTPDDLPQVGFRDFQLDYGLIATLVDVRINRLGVIDERLGDELDQLFQAFTSTLRAYAVLFFFRSDFTVGESWAPLLTQ